MRVVFVCDIIVPEPKSPMIPDNLRKQQRAITLSCKKNVLGHKLSPEAEAELVSLEKEAEIATKNNLRRASAQAKAIVVHQMKTKFLNIGTYSVQSAT